MFKITRKDFEAVKKVLRDIPIKDKNGLLTAVNKNEDDLEYATALALNSFVMPYGFMLPDDVQTIDLRGPGVFGDRWT